MESLDDFASVEDALEDTSILYALSNPPNALGQHSESQVISVTVLGTEYELLQRPEYQRGAHGVTGALLWNTTPILLTHLLTNRNTWRPFDDASRTVLELGSGIGLAACVLSELTRCSYIASDHDPALLTLIQKNISRNGNKASKERKSSSSSNSSSSGRSKVEIIELDWQDPGSTYLPLLHQQLTPPSSSIDVILCLDCVYSSHLSHTLLTCLESLTTRYPDAELIIGQQLREESVHAAFVEGLLDHFEVWRVKTEVELRGEREVEQRDRALDGFTLYRARRRRL